MHKPAKAAPRKAKACVMVATPVYDGKLVHQYVQSYLQSFTDCIRNDIILTPEFAAGFSLVQYARNWLMYCFLRETQFTHLLWIDADLGWDPTAIRRLIEAKKDIIGGCYTTKHPTKPVLPFVACGPVEGNLQEVSALPGGFLLMSRAVVQALWDNAEEAYMEHGGATHVIRHICDLEMSTVTKDGKYQRRAVGEDYVMQTRARALGFKMFLMTDIDMVHVGMYEFPANVAKAYAFEKDNDIKSMWHEDNWRADPYTPAPDTSRPVLVVPEREIPTPERHDEMVEMNKQKLIQAP